MQGMITDAVLHAAAGVKIRLTPTHFRHARRNCDIMLGGPAHFPVMKFGGEKRNQALKHT